MQNAEFVNLVHFIVSSQFAVLKHVWKKIKKKKKLKEKNVQDGYEKKKKKKKKEKKEQ